MISERLLLSAQSRLDGEFLSSMKACEDRYNRDSKWLKQMIFSTKKYLDLNENANQCNELAQIPPGEGENNEFNFSPKVSAVKISMTQPMNGQAKSPSLNDWERRMSQWLAQTNPENKPIFDACRAPKVFASISAHLTPNKNVVSVFQRNLKYRSPGHKVKKSQSKIAPPKSQQPSRKQVGSNVIPNLKIIMKPSMKSVAEQTVMLSSHVIYSSEIINRLDVQEPLRNCSSESEKTNSCQDSSVFQHSKPCGTIGIAKEQSFTPSVNLTQCVISSQHSKKERQKVSPSTLLAVGEPAAPLSASALNLTSKSAKSSNSIMSLGLSSSVSSLESNIDAAKKTERGVLAPPPKKFLQTLVAEKSTCDADIEKKLRASSVNKNNINQSSFTSPPHQQPEHFVFETPLCKGVALLPYSSTVADKEARLKAFRDKIALKTDTSMKSRLQEIRAAKQAKEKSLQEKILKQTQKENEKNNFKKTTANTHETSMCNNEIDNSSDDEFFDRLVRRPYPQWVQTNALDEALESQFGINRINPDLIFPDYFETCDLKAVFSPFETRRIRSKNYRGSTGNWSKDKLTFREKTKYCRDMGFRKDATVRRLELNDITNVF